MRFSFHNRYGTSKADLSRAVIFGDYPTTIHRSHCSALNQNLFEPMLSNDKALLSDFGGPDFEPPLLQQIYHLLCQNWSGIFSIEVEL